MKHKLKKIKEETNRICTEIQQDLKKVKTELDDVANDYQCHSDRERQYN